MPDFTPVNPQLSVQACVKNVRNLLTRLGTNGTGFAQPRNHAFCAVENHAGYTQFVSFFTFSSADFSTRNVSYLTDKMRGFSHFSTRLITMITSYIYKKEERIRV